MPFGFLSLLTHSFWLPTACSSQVSSSNLETHFLSPFSALIWLARKLLASSYHWSNGLSSEARFIVSNASFMPLSLAVVSSQLCRLIKVWMLLTNSRKFSGESSPVCVFSCSFALLLLMLARSTLTRVSSDFLIFVLCFARASLHMLLNFLLRVFASCVCKIFSSFRWSLI